MPITVNTLLRFTIMNSKSVRNMPSSFTKIKLRNSASCWLLLQELRHLFHLHLWIKPSYTWIISRSGNPPPPLPHLSFLDLVITIMCNECKTIYINLYIFLALYIFLWAKLSTSSTFCNHTIRNVHFTITFSNLNDIFIIRYHLHFTWLLYLCCRSQ